ncbi:MAG: MipA/OmpV family protein [Rhizobiales bacterium]|nr:MipA/OmpV family protein [Hyphomicrobiales bacterium]
MNNLLVRLTHSNIASKSFKAVGAALLSTSLMMGTSIVSIANASDLTERSGSSVQVGGGALIKPKYEGSDEYDVYGFPIIIPDFSGDSQFSFFKKYVEINGADDVRFKLLNQGGFTAGPLAGYTFGREEDDGDKLAGLGDVDEGLIVGGFVAYSFDVDASKFTLSSSYHQQVTGDEDGYLLRFSAGVERPLNERLKIKAKVGTTYADDEYFQTNFGVTSQQSLNSRANLAAFDADAGFKDVFVSLGTDLQLSESWKLIANVKYSRLLGDAEDSPVIETEDQFTGLIGLTYKFDWR